MANHNSSIKLSKKSSDDDRISKLPETVLHYILCFLSTQEAARTSVLSKPWRYLWTCLPDLDIKPLSFGRFVRIPTKDSISFDSMVLNIFLSRRVWCIRKLRLLLEPEYEYNLNSLRSILCYAVERNIEELDLCIYRKFSEFPTSLFCCSTLVVLKMHGEVVIGVGSCVRLPRLKVLRLEDVEFKDEDTVRNLFSGCPVLDYVAIGICVTDPRFHYEISSLTARRVILSQVCFKPLLPSKITVIAPSLEYLTIDYDTAPHVLVLENLPSSVHAIFNISPITLRYDYWGPMKAIFGGLCNVRFLELNVEYDEVQPDLHKIPISVFPRFDNLLELKIFSYRCPLPILLNMLPNCSRLEHLTLVSKIQSPCIKSHSWISPQQVPNCLAFRLTTITFEGFQGFEAEMIFIQYVISNSKVLRSITIRYKNNTNLDRKFGGFQKISGFVKQFATRCQLTFQQQL